MSEYNEFILEYAEDLDNADIFEEFNNYCIQEGYAKLFGAAILSIPKAILGMIRWILETMFKFLKKLKNKLSASIQIKADENGNVKVFLPDRIIEITEIKTFFKNIMFNYNAVVGATSQFLSKALYDLDSKTNTMIDSETLAGVINESKTAIKEEMDHIKYMEFFKENLKFDTEVEMPVDRVRAMYKELKNLYVDLNDFSKRMNRGYKELNKICDKLNKKPGKYDSVKLDDANKAMREMANVFTNVQKPITTGLNNINEYVDRIVGKKTSDSSTKKDDSSSKYVDFSDLRNEIKSSEENYGKKLDDLHSYTNEI